MGFTVTQLSKQYVSHTGDVTALKDLNLCVGEQEFVCVVGPSGCGKTTLLKILAGLIAPDHGRVEYAGQPGDKLHTAMVFQDQGLFPWMNVIDNVAFGLETQGVARPQRRLAAQALLQKVGLSDFVRSYPHELSGGMRQRVAILRAFLADPQILLMDEPFGALDSQTRLVMQEELLRIWREHRKAVVYVTHDIEEAVLLGDRVVVMSGRPGRILKEFPIRLERPRHTELRVHPQVAEMRWQIWKMLEDEVRKDLHIRK